MAVRIRMKRLGRKHRPFYRICAMDSREKRDGKTIEELGTYDPMVREKSERVKVDLERVDYWLSVGAQPSEKVAILIKKVRTNTFGAVKEPPKMQEPKPLPEPEAPAAEEPAGETSEEAPAAEGDAPAEAAEEKPAEEAAS